jgi:hypothetical protein
VFVCMGILDCVLGIPTSAKYTKKLFYFFNCAVYYFDSSTSLSADLSRSAPATDM